MYNYQDEAWRHSSRNGLIQAMFNELNSMQKFSMGEIYTFLEKIFGLGGRQIYTIISGVKVESAVSADDLALFVVILHRLSKGRRIKQ